MNAILELRRRAGLTQERLARAAGTSQPTIAAYESGGKSPTMQTVARIARSVGLEAVVSFVPTMTREDRRSLALHRAIAGRLVADPTAVLAHARDNLSLMRTKNPNAHGLLDKWDRILTDPVEVIVATMLDPDTHARELRKVTPFAGVLTAQERAAVYREFARRDAAA
jgi:transcriptional regulator with XRE-family HTH domain